jgi:glycosyltransferase involved in cell wall biosynthesis
MMIRFRSIEALRRRFKDSPAVQTLATWLRPGGRPLGRPAGELPIRLVTLQGNFGIAAAGELTARAFRALGFQVEHLAVPLGHDFTVKLHQPTWGRWIFHMNPHELQDALISLGEADVRGPRYGIWAYELPHAPPAWVEAAPALDEVWAPSAYVAGALGAIKARVRTCPHPLIIEDYYGVQPIAHDREFRAVTLFDFNSSMARKNPMGAIAAFREAFGEDGRCELIVKTQNGDRHPEALAGLRALAGANVSIVDAAWPYEQVKSLIAGADALISLHRAEGFGLVMAEAMALGVPVVATEATGNLDFMDPTCAMLVPARSIPVEDPQEIYCGPTWFEPDLGVAAEALRRLRAEPGFRHVLARASRRRVAKTLSPQAWLSTLPRSFGHGARPE